MHADTPVPQELAGGLSRPEAQGAEFEDCLNIGRLPCVAMVSLVA